MESLWSPAAGYLCSTLFTSTLLPAGHPKSLPPTLDLLPQQGLKSGLRHLHPPVWSSHHPTEQATEQAAVSDTASSSQPATCQKYGAAISQICTALHKARKSTSLHHTLEGLRPRVTALQHRLHFVAQAIAPAITGLPRHPAGAHTQRGNSSQLVVQRLPGPRTLPFRLPRFSPVALQLPFPRSSMASQPNASSVGVARIAGPPRNSDKDPVENPQAQGPA